MKTGKHFLIVLMLLMTGKLLAQPTILTQPTNQMVFANNSNTTFTVTVAGTDPCTYQWLFNGNLLSNGIITTIIGAYPSPPFLGDNGAATNARLVSPYDIARDTSGNIFIADTYQYRVRKVDTNGIITTLGTDRG
jgi:hypothetical protein